MKQRTDNSVWNNDTPWGKYKRWRNSFCIWCTQTSQWLWQPPFAPCPWGVQAAIVGPGPCSYTQLSLRVGHVLVVHAVPPFFLGFQSQLELSASSSSSSVLTISFFSSRSSSSDGWLGEKHQITYCKRLLARMLRLAPWSCRKWSAEVRSWRDVCTALKMAPVLELSRTKKRLPSHMGSRTLFLTIHRMYNVGIFQFQVCTAVNSERL